MKAYFVWGIIYIFISKTKVQVLDVVNFDDYATPKRVHRHEIPASEHRMIDWLRKLSF